LNDIFSLQDEISQAIVAALKLKLLPDEKKAIEQRGTSNPEAYQILLMARQQYVSGLYDSRRLRAALRLCERAVEIDPTYARAWALMATAQRLGVYFGLSGDNGLAAAQRALALDTNLAEAHAAIAGTLSSTGAFEAAVAEIDVALRLDPQSWDVNREAGRLYYRLRRFPEAIVHFEKASALIDSDWSSCSVLISCYVAVDDSEKARLAAQRTLAHAEKLAATEAGDGAIMASAVGALAYLGAADRAKEWADRAVLLDPDNLNMRYNLGCTMVTDLRDHEKALDLLEPFFAQASAEFLDWAKADPDFDAIREHPRLTAMVAKAEARLAGA
jgi:adenylate cyclase